MSASELASELGCSAQAVYMAFQNGKILKGGRIERQLAVECISYGPGGRNLHGRGQRPQYFFRHVVEETSAATSEVSLGYRSKLVPQGPFKIVQEAPEGVPVQVDESLTERVAELEKRLALEDTRHEENLLQIEGFLNQQGVRTLALEEHIAYKYAPDEVYAPGETLRGLLQAREIKQTELASYLGTSEKALSQLINGKVGLSQEMALKLQRVLGVQASFWNNLEARYQEYLTFKREEDRLCILTRLNVLAPEESPLVDEESVVESLRIALRVVTSELDEAYQRLAILEDELQRSNDVVQTLRIREAQVLQLLGGH